MACSGGKRNFLQIFDRTRPVCVGSQSHVLRTSLMFCDVLPPLRGGTSPKTYTLVEFQVFSSSSLRFTDALPLTSNSGSSRPVPNLRELLAEVSSGWGVPCRKTEFFLWINLWVLHTPFAPDNFSAFVSKS